MVVTKFPVLRVDVIVITIIPVLYDYNCGHGVCCVIVIISIISTVFVVTVSMSHT